MIFHSCKKEEVPTLSTSAITNITGTSATSGGTIISEGSGTIVERGICWSKGITPTVADEKTIEGGGAGTFVSNLSDLEGATTYYVRAYAKNEAGTGYGMAMSFTTLGQAPAATTQAATIVTTTSATLNGIVNGNYLSTNVTFEYGATTAYGSSVAASPSPVTGNTATNVTANASGLAAGTTYHFRIKTVNSLGTTNGNDMSFTTLGQAPTVIIQHACCLTSTGATLNGTVNANYLSTIVTFEYGTTTNYGTTSAATQSPVTGSAITNVSVNISGLTAATVYHYRIKAVNSLGTTYSNDISFTTIFTDIDGNIYNLVTIGTQVWMKENLRTTKYRNGDLIGTTTPATMDINAETTPKYQWAYGGNENNVATYGRLYTWYAATDSRNVCPTGYHIPTDTEWTTLTDYLTNNGYGYQGSGNDIGKSMAATSGWATDPTAGNLGNDQASNNRSGFTGFPGGYRGTDGNFLQFGSYSNWWSSTEFLGLYGYLWYMSYNSSNVNSTTAPMQYGLSVRCLKDN